MSDPHPTILAALDLAADAVPDEDGYLAAADQERLLALADGTGVATFSEWDESQHPRDAGKFARKEATKTAVRHMARAARIWHQKNHVDVDHPDYAGLDAAIMDADDREASSSPRNTRWRLTGMRTAAERLQAALSKHGPKAERWLQEMLQHTQAAQAALAPHDPGPEVEDWDVQPGTPYQAHAEDAQGHEHKGTGLGGGQFTSKGADISGQTVVSSRPRDYEDSYGQDHKIGGVNYTALASRDDGGKDRWEVFFLAQEGDKISPTGMTGAAGHQAVAVIRAIGRTIDEFMTQRQPAQVHFEAARGEHSRIQLYDRLAQKLATRHGYDLKRRKGWFGGITYTLTRPAGVAPHAENAESTATPDAADSFPVRLVNAEAVRNQSPYAQEFGLVATALGFPKLIPPGEIWLADNVPADERSFLIDKGMAQLTAMRRGDTHQQAEDHGEAVEKKERRRAEGAAHADQKAAVDAPKTLHSAYADERGQPVRVFLVDGASVRQRVDPFFMEGGHDRVYHYIPHGEIWLERTLHPAELPAILLHESHEREDMGRGLSYDKAHGKAAAAEFRFRQEANGATAHAEDAVDIYMQAPRRLFVRQG